MNRRKKNIYKQKTKNETRNIFCLKCNTFTSFLNAEIYYIFNKLFAFCIICSKCGKNNDNIFREKEHIRIVKAGDGNQ